MREAAWLVVIAVLAWPRSMAAAMGPNVRGVPSRDDVLVTAERVGPPPLPYQAVRIRLILRNTSSKRLGPLYNVDQQFRILGIRRPGSSSYLSVAHVVLLYDPDRPSGPTARARLNRMRPLVLKPHDETSVTFASAAEWRLLGSRVPRPLFDKPGGYSVKVGYGRPWSEDLVADPITMVVPKPEGDDALICQMLAANPALAMAMMSPVHRPETTVIPALKKIVERFPESSYVNYARFALARWHMKGLEITENASEEGRAAALGHLERIDTRRFAYGPNTVITLLKVLSRSVRTSRQLDRVRTLEKALQDEWADSVERLDYRAESLSQEEWRQMSRRRVPQTVADPSQPTRAVDSKLTPQ